MMNRRAFLSGIAAFGAIAPLSAIAANNAGPLMTRNNLADLNDPAAARLATVVPTYVPTTTAMAALNPAKDLVAVLTATGAAGAFEVLTLASLSAGEQAAAAADNAARRICYVIPTADATKVYRRIYSGPISVLWAGAVVDGTTNDVVAIQAAVTLCNALGGGVVQLGVGTSVIKPGSLGGFGGLPYCIGLLSNVTLQGFGDASVLKIVADPAIGHTPYCIGVATFALNDTSYLVTNVGVRKLKIDGNSAANNTAGYISGGVWLWGAQDILIEDVFAYDCGAFHFWMRNTDRGFGRGIKAIAPSTSLTGDDGFHISDGTNWALSDLYISVWGDDQFVIDATSHGSHDISVKNLLIEIPNRGIGVRMFGQAGHNYEIYNVDVQAIIKCTGASAGPCVGLAQAVYYNTKIDAKCYNSNGFDLSLDVQSDAPTRSIKNCDFTIESYNNAGASVATFNSAGTIDQNTLNALIYNPFASGTPGQAVILGGSNWKGSINLNYDPSGAKVGGTQRGIDMSADHCDLAVSVNGAATNIFLRNTAQFNTWRLGKLSGASSKDIDGASGSTNNTFIGGSLGTGVTIADASWRFYGSPQFEGYGTANITTDGSGNANIAHGLAGTPRTVSVTIDGDVAYQVDVQAVDGTNIQVRLKNPATNADVAATQNVMWRASL